LSNTVLLVDDNPIQLSARQQVLSQAGLEVQVATSAESALALLRTLSQSEKVRVVVTDHIMPQATGSEFVQMLREINPGVPVIVISGGDAAKFKARALQAGAIAYFQKPVNNDELLALIKQTLAAPANPAPAPNPVS